jgi:hypothetical protein
MAAAGATIRYTTDGTAPTASSSIYSEPITLSGNTILQAQAFADGWTPSAVTTEAYQIDATPPTLIATVLAAALAPGMQRWTLTQTAGPFAGAPIPARRVDELGADLFAVEAASESGPYTVRALGADGSHLWTENAPGIPLFGDVFGGMIAVVRPEGWGGYYGTALARFAGAADAPPWRYESPRSIPNWGNIRYGVAQGQDGTIYFLEDRLTTPAGPEGCETE